MVPRILPLRPPPRACTLTAVDWSVLASWPAAWPPDHLAECLTLMHLYRHLHLHHLCLQDKPGTCLGLTWVHFSHLPSHSFQSTTLKTYHSGLQSPQYAKPHVPRRRMRRLIHELRPLPGCLTAIGAIYPMDLLCCQTRIHRSGVVSVLSWCVTPFIPSWPDVSEVAITYCPACVRACI